MIISVACCTHITIDGHTITNLYILRMSFYIIMFDLYVICLILPIACCSANWHNWLNGWEYFIIFHNSVGKVNLLRYAFHYCL